MKKLLVTGSTGMLGSNLALAAEGRFDVIGLDLDPSNPLLRQQVQVDLTDHDRVCRVVGEIAPDYVVHCAAMTNVDGCESDPLRARAANALATENLVRAAGQAAKFIYISTASVFNGERGGYAEADLTSPVNMYARTKLEGELFVEKGARDHVIIRTDIVGWNLVRGQSFVEWIVNNLRQHKQIGMFTDVVFTPITVNTLADVVLQLCGGSFNGRLHVGVSAPVSKYDFGKKLAACLELDEALIRPVLLASCGLKAKRPKNTALDTGLLSQVLGKSWDIDGEIARLVAVKEAGR